MTSVSTIIKDAYRQSNLIPVNGEVTVLQQAEALRYLNRIVKSVFGNEAGENLEDLPVGINNVNLTTTSIGPVYNPFVVPPNKRCVVNITEATTLYLDPNPSDGERVALIDASGASSGEVYYEGTPLTLYGQPINFDDTFPGITLKGNGRLIDGSTEITLATSGFNVSWFYRADLGSWTVYSPLTVENTVFPFPEEFDDFFITMLAGRLNPAYGTQMDPQSVEIFRRAKTQFQARYHNTIFTRSELGLLHLPRTYAGRYIGTSGWYDYDPTSTFNRGYLF